MGRMYYDRDISLAPLEGKRIAVIGYGSQARAHAQNLRDGGFDVVVGLREGSGSRAAAKQDSLRVSGIEDAVQSADLISLLIPDEEQPQAYAERIAPALTAGKAIIFAHGFSIHYGLIQPPNDVDVLLVAPKGPGPSLRKLYREGAGLASLFAAAQNVSGQGRERALAYARAIGSAYAGALETTFKEETEADLFGEQSVLCGGLTHLIQTGFETLLEAGYQPEIAYFETVHEVKLVVDLLHERGLAGMRRAISNTAEFGDYVTGPRIITEQVRAEMKNVLGDIQSGKFAESFMREAHAGFPLMRAQRQLTDKLELEKVGERLRQSLLRPEK